MEAGKIAGIQEGADYGTQTGFQRYIALGILHGRCAVWRFYLDDIDDRVKRQEEYLLSGDPTLADLMPEEVEEARKRVNKAGAALAGLEKLLDRDNLPMTNDDVDVAKFEQIIRKAKSKAKIVQNALKMKLGDGFDIDVDDPPISYMDEKIQKMLKPIEDVLEEFRI